MFEDIKKNHYLQFLKIIFKIIKKSLSNKVTHVGMNIYLKIL